MSTTLMEIYESFGTWLRRGYIYSIVSYTALVLLIIFLFFMLYIRSKFKFWSMQPVFHVYDFYYYFFPPGIILHDLPEVNKYCNFKNVDFIPYSKMTDIQVNKMIRFVQKHYLKNKDNVFVPKKENIVPYFTGHNCESFISIYSEDELLLDTKTGGSIENKRCVSVMTTRPLHIVMNNGDKDAFFDVYYVDYLCVDKDYRKKGIAPQVIQTHEYYQRLKNKSVKVSLFKREGELTGIVPLCVYSTYGFNLLSSNWFQNIVGLNPSLGLVEIGPKNMHNLTNFIKTSHQKKFDIVGLPETSNLAELIKTKNIYCYIVVEDFNVLCAYFFRKTCTYMRKGVQVLACIASINCSNNELFVTAYKMVLNTIRLSDSTFQYAVIEDISDNNIILQDIKKTEEPDIVSPTAYFFYNFAYHTIRPNRVLLIN